MADQFDIDRLASIEARIIIFEDAVTALVDDGIQQYTLDTGQSRQTVTKIDVIRLTNTLEKLYSLRDTYYARVHGGSIIARPGW